MYLFTFNTHYMNKLITYNVTSEKMCSTMLQKLKKKKKNQTYQIKIVSSMNHLKI